MAENSRIEWTHHTFNPWIGCQKVGPGCDQCQAAGVAFHFKQWGEWGPGATRDTPADRNEQVGTLWSVSTVFGGPAYLAIREGNISQLMERFGKKAAGRLLDGRTWDEMPGVCHG